MLSIYGRRSETQAALYAIQCKAWERTRVSGRWAFMLGTMRSLMAPTRTNWWVYLYVMFLVVPHMVGRGWRVDWHGFIEILVAMASGSVVTALLIGVWGWGFMERRYRAGEQETGAALVD